LKYSKEYFFLQQEFYSCNKIFFLKLVEKILLQEKNSCPKNKFLVARKKLLLQGKIFLAVF